MQRILIIALIFLCACAPAATPIPTATPYPTNTPYPTYTPYPTFTPIPSPTFTATPAIDGTAVVAAFKAAGLEAENPSHMVKDDYGPAPYVCEGTHFLVPKICSDCGGRVFVCPNERDRDLIFDYYNEMGRGSALLFSWAFKKDLIVVQINGDLDEKTARQYEATIP
jgi:hypothetical protein